MGLFSRPSSTTPPRGQRADLAAAIKNAPPRELERLSWVQVELDYLSKTLAAEETIIGAASCDDPTLTRVALGVIALTSTRLVAVIGVRDKGGPRGRTLGEPNVYSMALKQLSEFSFGSHNIRGIHGYAAVFRLEGSGELILNVGQDDKYSE
jgi:hypothetical protein